MPTIGPSSRAGSMPIARKCARRRRARAPAASPARARRRSASCVHRGESTRRTCRRVRLGLLSTADINGAILGARADDAPFEIVAVGSRDAARAQAYAARARHRARARLLRRAARRPRASTRSTSRCRTRSTTSGRCARSRPASTCSARSRTRGTRSEVDEAWDEAERARARAHRGVHVAPARADAADAASCCRRLGELRAVHATFSAIAPARRRRALGAASSAAARCSTSAATASAPRASSRAREPDRVHGEAQPAAARSTSSSPGRCASAT